MAKFCDLEALRNEADVEQSFVRKLLEALGYIDTEIVPKASLDELDVKGMRGRRQAKYRPDFALKPGNDLRFLIEAKAPSEDLDEHEWQPRAYSILLNGSSRGKVIEYYLLTNGIETRLYDPLLNEAIYRTTLSSLNSDAAPLEMLRRLMGRDTTRRISTAPSDELKLRKLSLNEINQVFAWCHQHIYRKDHISQSDAFTEFVKLISLKLMSDREIKSQYPQIINRAEISVPASQVKFSLNWLARHKLSSANPMSDLQFQNFMRDQESEIARGIRKRMFDPGEGIKLNPETIEGVVRKLESVFLFGIDADLNGRLFETFLNATMRGKDLGQFFTPRSLVKLGVGLAQFKVRQREDDESFHTDTVIDACCGSGGFLIDALAEMWAKADALPLSPDEKELLKREIANQHIVGVDVANAPKLARIARLNMYLHGDGGAKIYHTNALDKRLPDRPNDTPEILLEKTELRKLLAKAPFDVALTNPPFAKALDRSTEEETAILAGYEIAKAGELKSGSVRSNLLFIERYKDILKPGGRLVTILDDGILSGDDYAWFRAKFREWFIIKAVVSLPGDAFQRSNARVKTSYVVAVRRDETSIKTCGGQGPIFMYPCIYVGLDDPKRQRTRAGDAELRDEAKNEISTVLKEYNLFQNGSSTEYLFEAGDDTERLDVKYRMFKPNRQVRNWLELGHSIAPLAEYLEPRKYSDSEIVSGDSEESVRVMVVRYSGKADETEEVVPKDSSYGKLYPVREGDIVISHIAASYGSIAVVPSHLDGCVVSNEYAVLKAKDNYDPEILKLILRSPEIRADILLSSSGANRTRTKWKFLETIQAPYPSPAEAFLIKGKILEAQLAFARAQDAFSAAQELAERDLHLISPVADRVLQAFRPPK